jgi:hypothetical protein
MQFIRSQYYSQKSQHVPPFGWIGRDWLMDNLCVMDNLIIKQGPSLVVQDIRSLQQVRRFILAVLGTQNKIFHFHREFVAAIIFGHNVILQNANRVIRKNNSCIRNIKRCKFIFKSLIREYLITLYCLLFKGRRAREQRKRRHQEQ